MYSASIRLLVFFCLFLTLQKSNYHEIVFYFIFRIIIFSC